ncbi:bacillithiol biosynthesis deacetylase BshB1 [Thermoflavifilum thermophilum]|uniref:Bacillithiol biosynthesis deacetylase BshB1 n=1 Tax=Thermoflavifilum thermophilum TaxID=1393122 RepID=A0A1I7NK01_9BACT|nr:bacillithiol biosynthesis deacetylase BshB1 [Thermoflavifilum thermophilum]SFV34958.1 bacillithiol biosynthesis deacetylase BshB1 [Thermoflavifilum thermophilum]
MQAATHKLDILAIAAHPDDVELSCAGTLMVHVQMGHRVGILDLTAGELGTRGTPEIRAAEARKATEIMGVEIRENASLPDGFFRNDQEHQLRLIPFIRYFQPDIVLTNAEHDRHPDHGRAAELVETSCFLSGLIKIETHWKGQPQQPWRPRHIWHFIQDEDLEPDFIVDISPVMDKKLEAIKAFRSQFLANPDDPLQTYISTPAFFEHIVHLAQMWGYRIGTQYGEGFTSRKKLGVSHLHVFV